MAAVWLPLDSPEPDVVPVAIHELFLMTMETLNVSSPALFRDIATCVARGLLGRIFSALLAWASVQNLQAASTFVLGSPSAGPGENAVVDIQFQSDGSPVAVQFDLHFDAARLAPGYAVAGPAMNGFVVRSGSPGSGVARILVYSDANRALGNGVVARFPLRVLPAAPGGATPLSVSNVVVSSTAGARVEPVSTSGGSVTVRNETAPTFRSPTLAANGQVVLTLEGQDGRSYTLQASSDLVGWQTLTTAVAARGVAVFTDVLAAAQTYRYYRAVLTP